MIFQRTLQQEGFAWCANLLVFSRPLRVRGVDFDPFLSLLNPEESVDVITFFCTVVIDSVPPVVAEIVDTDGVGIEVHDF